MHTLLIIVHLRTLNTSIASNLYHTIYLFIFIAIISLSLIFNINTKIYRFILQYISFKYPTYKNIKMNLTNISSCVYFRIVHRHNRHNQLKYFKQKIKKIAFNSVALIRLFIAVTSFRSTSKSNEVLKKGR